MNELINARLHDKFCSEICRLLNEGKICAFELYSNELLVLTATPDRQIVIQHSLKKCVLWFNHNPVLAGQPGGRKLYALIMKIFYWPAFTTYCYRTVRTYPDCARNRLKLRQNVG